MSLLILSKNKVKNKIITGVWDMGYRTNIHGRFIRVMNEKKNVCIYISISFVYHSGAKLSDPFN